MPATHHTATTPLAEAYPLSPALFRHHLTDDSLLTLPALAEAARRLPPQHVERRIHDARNGQDFSLSGWEGDPAQVVSDMTGQHWIMLRFIEQLPDYRDLLDRALREIGPVIQPRTGKADAMKGFVFISAPGTHTPFHFDAEYNVLFQIAGDKTFATYPPQPPYLNLAQREAYHRRGENMLPWEDGFEEQATLHRLAPGDALYVPYAAPHWVRAGSCPSISLSLTWQSAWSMDAADALAANSLLRRLGFPGGELPAWPSVPRWRAYAGRAARRLGLV